MLIRRLRDTALCMLVDKRLRNNTNENHYCTYVAVDNANIEWWSLLREGTATERYQSVVDDLEQILWFSRAFRLQA